MYVPAVVGVPAIAPVAAFNERPGGNAPAVMLHVIGAVPPVAAGVELYATPMVPLGNTGELRVSCKFTTKLTTCVAVRGGVAESVHCNVKLDVPTAEGVPEITPVDAFSESPAGKLPFVTSQVVAPTAPVAVRVAV